MRIADRLRPDLALVDVRLLDGPTGIDVARHVVDRLDGVVVFMTGNRQALPRDLAGACGVIANPTRRLVSRRPSDSCGRS